MAHNDYRMHRIRGYEFEDKILWTAIFADMGADVDYDRPRNQNLETHTACQCCGGYTGQGYRDPEYCSAGQRAGETDS